MSSPLFSANISKKKKFVADGVFFAELNEFFVRELVEAGYSGAEVRKTAVKFEIIILATYPAKVLGKNSKKILELTAVIQKRFKFEPNTIKLFALRIPNRGLCAIAQCESLRHKLYSGLSVRRACYGLLRAIMESGAKGCEIVVSGKLRAQRAKSMKFVDGFMIHSGQPAIDYVDVAVRHIKLRQGVMGIKVKIMLPTNTKDEFPNCPSKPLPDFVKIYEPKEEVFITTPTVVFYKTEDDPVIQETNSIKVDS